MSQRLRQVADRQSEVGSMLFRIAALTASDIPRRATIDRLQKEAVRLANELHALADLERR